MPSFVKVYSCIEAVHEKKHNLGSDTIKCMLTASAGSQLWTQKSDVTEISAGNGYTAGGASLSGVSSSQSTGTYYFICSDIAWTASGGSIGPFRTAVFYNDTATNDEILGYIDYGIGLTLADTQVFTVDVDSVNGLFYNT